jgi:hypothetical protein
VIRELLDACGSARAALGHLQETWGQPGTRLPIALIVLARMIDAYRRRIGRPELAPLKCIWPDEQIMTPAQIAVHRDLEPVAPPSNPLALLDKLAHRFQGVDLQYRRDASWDAPWRAANHTSKGSNERFRVTVCGVTPEDAIAKLSAAIDAIDREQLEDLSIHLDQQAERDRAEFKADERDVAGSARSDHYLVELRAKVAKHGVTMLTEQVPIGKFAILHPSSAMPSLAPEGFLQLDHETYVAIEAELPTQGVAILGGQRYGGAP